MGELSLHGAWRILKLLQLLGRSRFWFIGLIGSVLFVLLPLAGRTVLSGWRPWLVEGVPRALGDGGRVLGRGAGQPSAVEDVPLLPRVFHGLGPFSVSGLLAEGLRADRRVPRWAFVAVGTAVGLCWARAYSGT